MNNIDVINFLKQNREFIQHEFGVVRMGLFGSFARETAREDSDVDIAVAMRDERIFRNFFRLEKYLQEHLRRKIDLGLEDSLKPLARQRVKEEIIYV